MSYSKSINIEKEKCYDYVIIEVIIQLNDISKDKSNNSGSVNDLKRRDSLTAMTMSRS